ncbi:MAG: hypothetical protein PUE87_06680 [Subdoligranulum variabile]|nr:hypothetical protein [Subdoligranulum variabile]
MPTNLAQHRVFRGGFLTRQTDTGEQCSPLQEFFDSLGADMESDRAANHKFCSSAKLHGRRGRRPLRFTRAFVITARGAGEQYKSLHSCDRGYHFGKEEIPAADFGGEALLLLLLHRCKKREEDD